MNLALRGWGRGNGSWTPAARPGGRRQLPLAPHCEQPGALRLPLPTPGASARAGRGAAPAAHVGAALLFS
jgi:hypothetical protein